MAAKAVVVTVDDASAVALFSGLGFGDQQAGLAGMAVNSGATTVYIGGADVNTTDKGYPLAAGKEFDFRAGPQDDIYAICATGESGEITLFLLGV